MPGLRASIRNAAPEAPRMALDLDGVFCDLLGTAVKRCGIALPFDGYATAPGYAIRSWGLDRDQIRAVASALYDPETCLQAEPHEGAIDAWRILERLGELYVITARADRYRDVTDTWLARHDLMPREVIHTSDKASAAAERGITIAFEDSPKHLVAYWDQGITAFKPDYPYTRKAPGTPYGSWAHLFEHEPLASLLADAIAKEGASA